MSGWLVAVRKKNASEWEFFFVNDTDQPVEEVVLEEVSYEWGDTGNSTEVGKSLGPVAPRSFVAAWIDDSDAAELRMDLKFRMGDRTVRFELPKLYRLRSEVDAPVFGKALYVTGPYT